MLNSFNWASPGWCQWLLVEKDSMVMSQGCGCYRWTDYCQPRLIDLSTCQSWCLMDFGLEFPTLVIHIDVSVFDFSLTDYVFINRRSVSAYWASQQHLGCTKRSLRMMSDEVRYASIKKKHQNCMKLSWKKRQ